jgi:predicted TIM-barrel fold metal-dependent hydrolase
MITPAKCLEHLDRLELDDETRRRFLGANAARVFGLA